MQTLFPLLSSSSSSSSSTITTSESNKGSNSFADSSWFEFVVDPTRLSTHLTDLKNGKAIAPSGLTLAKIFLKQARKPGSYTAQPKRTKTLASLAAKICHELSIPLEKIEKEIPIKYQRLLLDELASSYPQYVPLLHRWVLRGIINAFSAEMLLPKNSLSEPKGKYDKRQEEINIASVSSLQFLEQWVNEHPLTPTPTTSTQSETTTTQNEVAIPESNRGRKRKVDDSIEEDGESDKTQAKTVEETPEDVTRWQRSMTLGAIFDLGEFSLFSGQTKKATDYLKIVGDHIDDLNVAGVDIDRLKALVIVCNPSNASEVSLKSSGSNVLKDLFAVIEESRKIGNWEKVVFTLLKDTINPFLEWSYRLGLENDIKSNPNIANTEVEDKVVCCNSIHLTINNKSDGGHFKLIFQNEISRPIFQFLLESIKTISDQVPSEKLGALKNFLRRVCIIAGKEELWRMLVEFHSGIFFDFEKDNQVFEIFEERRNLTSENMDLGESSTTSHSHSQNVRQALLSMDANQLSQLSKGNVPQALLSRLSKNLLEFGIKPQTKPVPETSIPLQDPYSLLLSHIETPSHTPDVTNILPRAMELLEKHGPPSSRDLSYLLNYFVNSERWEMVTSYCQRAKVVLAQTSASRFVHGIYLNDFVLYLSEIMGTLGAIPSEKVFSIFSKAIEPIFSKISHMIIQYSTVGTDNDSNKELKRDIEVNTFAWVSVQIFLNTLTHIPSLQTILSYYMGYLSAIHKAKKNQPKIDTQGGLIILTNMCLETSIPLDRYGIIAESVSTNYSSLSASSSVEASLLNILQFVTRRLVVLNYGFDPTLWNKDPGSSAFQTEIRFREFTTPPKEGKWMVFLGDVQYDKGSYLNAIRYYLLSAAIETGFFSDAFSPLPHSLIVSLPRLIFSLIILRAFPQAACLCQMLQSSHANGQITNTANANAANPHPSSAPSTPPTNSVSVHSLIFRLLQEDFQITESSKYYQYLWEIPLIELLLHINHTRHKDKNVGLNASLMNKKNLNASESIFGERELMSLISAPELNEHNPPEIRLGFIQFLKRDLFKTLCEEFLGYL